MLFEKLQKTEKTHQLLFEESCQTSEVVPNNPSQDEILPGRLFIFLQKWLVQNLSQKLKNPKYMFIKRTKLVPQTEKKHQPLFE